MEELNLLLELVQSEETKCEECQKKAYEQMEKANSGTLTYVKYAAVANFYKTREDSLQLIREKLKLMTCL